MIELKNLTPMKHQLTATDFFIKNEGRAIFAHDVGCGKTVSTLLCLHEISKRVPEIRLLVICPTNLINKTWGKNIKQFTDCNFYNCREDRAYYFQDHREIRIFAINYESMIRPNHQKRLKKLLEKFPFMMVLDESHKIKDRSTRSAKVIGGEYKSRGRKGGSVRVPGLKDQAQYRLCLSGTPAPNSSVEWFSQVEFCDDAIFNMKFVGFRAHYFVMRRESFGGHIDLVGVPSNIRDLASKGYKMVMRENMKAEFFGKLANIVHYAKAKDCLDLPDYVDIYRTVQMDAKQKKAYRDMDKKLVIEMAETERDITAKVALVKRMKLNQIANGFCYRDGIEEEREKEAILFSHAKVKELLNILEEIGDKPVVIWGHYHFEIQMILDALKGQAVDWYGKTKDGQGEINYQNFIDGKVQYLVAHPASASEGLDMIHCQYQVFCSLDESILQYTQCRGRTLRKGQDKKCFFIHILTEGTVDEELVDVLQGKKTLEEFTHEFITRIKRYRQEKKLVQEELSKREVH